MRPVISCAFRNAVTDFGVSPRGSTDTATTRTLLASAPSFPSVECRFAVISGQTSGQCV